MKRRRVLILAAVLAGLGLSIFYYKVTQLGLPLSPEAETEVWTVESRLRFQAQGGGVVVNSKIPSNPPGFALLDENFVSRGFSVNVQQEDGNREARWARRRNPQRQQTLYYRAVVYRETPTPAEAPQPPFPPVPQLGEPHDTAMAAVVDAVRMGSADVATFTSELLRRMNDPNPDQEVQLFLSDAHTPLERTVLATTLLAGARIPSRITRGVFLQDQIRDAEIEPWLEVHDGRRWLNFDPETGEQGLPPNFLIWWRGTSPLIEVHGGTNALAQIAIQRNKADAMLVAEQRAVLRDSKALEFSTLSLPIATQTVYEVLLLIPIGALVMVLMRNVVGVQTFGTFMPILIALAFRETKLLYGIILFTLIIAAGLAIRFLLEKLRLLLVPRLASVLIVVVLLMLAISILGHRLGLESGLSVALFPMVILTMVIERMSIVWEERGAGEAIKEGVGSLFVAALAYAAMGYDKLAHLVFVFPELLLVLLAATILLGRYTGYRLTELLRFKALGS